MERIKPGSLTDFSDELARNDIMAEDNVNVYASTGITISNGWSIEHQFTHWRRRHCDGSSGNVTVPDVDAIHQGNACFGIYGGGGHDVTFTNVRCRDNHCTNRARQSVIEWPCLCD